MTKANLMTEIEKWAEKKAERIAKVQDKFGKTGCSIQGGEVIEKDGKATTCKPKVVARRTYQAKNDFTANALRTVLPFVLQEKFENVVKIADNSILVRTADIDYVVKVSKLKFREEDVDSRTLKNPVAKALVGAIDTLDGLYVEASKDSAILVHNANFEQYEIRVVTKRDRVEL